MKNYKLLRLFVLCNCIVLSGQVFGMNRRGGATFTVNTYAGGESHTAETMTVGGIIAKCANCNEDLQCATCDFRIDKLSLNKNGKKADNEFCWKTEGYSFKNGNFKKKTVLELKNNGSCVKLTGIKNLNDFLVMKVKNSSDEKTYLKYVEKSGFLPFSTMKDFVKMDTTEGAFTISVVNRFDQARSDLQKLIKVFKQKNGNTLPKVLFYLLIAKSYEGEMNFDICDSTLQGNVVCQNPSFDALRSVINIDGSSEKHATFNLDQSTFSGNFQVLKGTVKLALKKNSSIKFYSNPDGKKITVRGSVKKNSKTYLSKNIINNVRYDLTSNKYSIKN